MFAFILDPSSDPKVELIRRLVAGLGFVVKSVRSLQLLADARAEAGQGGQLILVPETAAPQVSLSDVVALAASLTDGTFLVYVADAIEPDKYKALVRTGSADWVAWDSALGEIREIVQRRRSVPALVTEPANDIPHTVLTFLGAVGGAGTTTLALEAGIWLAGQKGANRRNVAVVDLDPQNSIICDYADLTPRVNLVELGRDPERLDDYLLNIFTTQHPSGLHIFAVEHQRIDIASVDPAAIFTLLNRLVERYQIVIVDAGTTWLPWTDGVLAHSDRVMLVSRYTVPSVKALTRRLADIRELGITIASTAVVLNQCGTGLFGRHIRRKEIDALFSGVETFYVAADPETAIECIDTGQSVVKTASHTGMAKDIGKVAESLLKVRTRV